MSCELYIGNFPSSLTSEDLIVLFQDFDGIEFLRIIKKEKKCFAFFRCVDQDQAAHVAMTMNGIDVCGRNLIVRSSDDKLQAKIEKSPQSFNQMEKQFADLSLNQSRGTQNTGSEYSYHDNHSSIRKPPLNSQPRGAQNAGSEYSHHENQSGIRKPYPNSQPRGAQNAGSEYSYHDNHSGIQKPHPNSQPRGAQNTDPEYSYHEYHSGIQNDGRKPNPRTMPFSRGARVKENTFCETPENNYGNHDYSIGFYDERVEHADSKSSHSSYGGTRDYEPQYQDESEADAEISKDELFFVSVVNFPLGTPVRDLYELFSDYNPFKVFMVCNYPRPDKLPTEAIVSFISQSDATDAIINLDNTVYRKRVLLVTDAADTSIVPELLSLG